MKPRFPEDSRDVLWAKLEHDIQGRAKNKDKAFRLAGKWKRYIGKRDGLRLYAVEVEWVRNNLSVIYGHGGHGMVHEFIPHGEIWISTHHYKGCGCRNVRKDYLCSPEYFASTGHHEMVEYRLMKRGMQYWKAHHMAIEAEKSLGLLKDPFSDIDF